MVHDRPKNTTFWGHTAPIFYGTQLDLDM